MSHALLRRLVAGAAGAALAVTAIAPAHAAAPDDSAAEWLSGQLTSGLIHNPNFGGFDDYGLTVDTGFAIEAIGQNRGVLRQVRKALAPHVGDYVEFEPAGDGQLHVGAGSLAKLAAFVQVAGADATSYGGRNLVVELESRVSANGRIEDKLITGDAEPWTPGTQADTDYANVIGQGFAVRTLAKAGSAKAAAATTFLLKQQCEAGFFRLNFTTDKSAANQSCTAGATGSEADTDVTSLSIIALTTLKSGDPAVTAAIKKAVAWLKAQQKADGAYGGGTSTSTANSNSTGLAAWALSATHECATAGKSAAWVKTLQVAGATGALASEDGAIAYDQAGLTAAKSAGITNATSDQWRRATAQAGPGLTALLSNGTVKYAGTTDYQRAGTPWRFSTSGTGDGGNVCFAGPGVDGEQTLADTDGAPTVTLPAQTGTATYTFTTAAGTQTVTVPVLAGTKFTVKRKKKKVTRKATQVIKVSGLAAGERVVVKVRGKVVAKGAATSAGRFKAKFVIKGAKLARLGKAKVKVQGQFPTIRKGKTTFKVVR